MSLTKKLFSGMIWTSIDMFLVKGIAFVATLYLARLLGPDVFGLLGMMSVFIAIGTSLVESGLSESIIRTTNPNKVDFSTVFYFNIFSSIVVYFCIYILAAPIAEFYGQEILTELIRVYCIVFLINGLSSVQLAILVKNMSFRKITRYNLPATLCGAAVGVFLAHKNCGAWSLVWMQIVNKFILSCLLWFHSEWKLTFDFSLTKLKYHYNYGYKLLLSGLLNKVFLNVYHVIIGKNYSIQTIGYYERSSSFNAFSSDALTGIIKKVTFPLISSVKDDKVRTAKIYKKLLTSTFFVSVPIMMGLAAIAKPLFLLVLGVEWLPAVIFFQILCLASAFYPTHSLNLNVLKIYGRTDVFLKLEIYKKILVTVCILFALPFGVFGLVWSSVVASLLSLLINASYSGELINYNSKSQILDMLPVVSVALITFILMCGCVSLLDEFSLLVQIAASVVVGVIAYITLSVVFKISALNHSIQTIKIIRK